MRKTTFWEKWYNNGSVPEMWSRLVFKKNEKKLKNTFFPKRPISSKKKTLFCKRCYSSCIVKFFLSYYIGVTSIYWKKVFIKNLGVSTGIFHLLLACIEGRTTKKNDFLHRSFLRKTVFVNELFNILAVQSSFFMLAVTSWNGEKAVEKSFPVIELVGSVRVRNVSH